MALNIRNQETEQLAEELARLTGETKTQAVTQALRERLARFKRHRGGRRLADELDDTKLQFMRYQFAGRGSPTWSVSAAHQQPTP